VNREAVSCASEVRLGPVLSRAIGRVRKTITSRPQKTAPASGRPISKLALSKRVAILTVAALLAVGTTATPAVAQTAEPQSSATLRPGDSLRVRVWREPDLSGAYMVDEHGDLTLPRIGRRSVLNVPIDSIRSRIQREYAEFVRDASVEITPLYRVRVTGAVRNPGLFTVNPTMTVGDVIGLAGGATPTGKQNGVELVRDGRRLPVSISPSNQVVSLGLRSGDELYVPERKQIGRYIGMALGAVSTFASLYWVLHR
jgi:protein involved in polysaccharide export with SLBB domain